jgi:iron complex outermembrane receptor protein
MSRISERSAVFRRFGFNAWPVIIGVTGLLFTASPPALAQQGAAQNGNPRADGKGPKKAVEILGEVVVTAQRRHERLLTVPMAITALTSADLDQLNAVSFDDYFRDVPGLALIDTGTGSRDFTLRGMNNNGLIVNPNTVAIATVSQYVDDIPVTAAGFQLDPHLTDVERIEVLRGPQGTYYGEGALAGTIRIITKPPVLDRFSATAEARFSGTEHGGSNHDEDIMLNLPLVEDLAALRVSAYHTYDSGYVKAMNVTPDFKITGVHARGQNTDSSTGYRTVLLLEPMEQLKITAQAAHYDSTQILGSYDPAFGDLLSPVIECNTSTPGGGGTPGGGTPGGGGTGGAGGGGSGPSTGGSCASGGSYFTARPSGDLYNLTLNGDFGWARLVSSSSYADTQMILWDTQEQYDAPSTPGEYTTPDGPTYVFNTQNQETFTQELRLVSSTSWSRRWDYVLGLFYQSKHTIYGTPAAPVAYGGVNNSSTQELKVNEDAVFADAGYMLTRHLQARLGARASVLNNESIVVIEPPLGPTSTPNTFSHYTPFTGRAVLNDFITPDMTAYLSVASGFRNGNLNNTTNNYGPLSTQPGYTRIPTASKPDTDTTYEFGWKQVFPTHRASFNAAVYYTRWHNMQVLSLVSAANNSIPEGIESAFVNAPNAVIKGVEVEGKIELLRGLELGASWSLIDPRLTADFPLNINAEGTYLHGKPGDYLPWVARSSGSFTLNYTHHLVGSLNGFLTANAAYVGPRATDFDKLLDSTPPVGTSPQVETTYVALHSYWTSGAQLGVQNDQWRIALYGENLADSRADLFHGPQGAFTNRPLTVGLWVRYNTK